MYDLFVYKTKEAIDMIKRILLVAVVAVMTLGLFGCLTDYKGVGIWQTWKEHLQQHLLVASHEAVEMHREFDYFFFDLDERDPDDY